ncbi:MAG: hypothetical protein HGB22_02995, partial [Chlorobiaceae bacterium]|nr:hypothetical protein [Chlorobiaceae bacterium]
GTQNITVTGNTLSGADRDNYTLVQQTGLSAAITPYSLAVSGLTANSKIYDGTREAVLSGTALIAPLSGDDVTLGGTPVGTFADKYVGTGKAVTVTGSTISGTDAGNYNLLQQSGLTANINPSGYTGFIWNGSIWNEELNNVWLTSYPLDDDQILGKTLRVKYIPFSTGIAGLSAGG